MITEPQKKSAPDKAAQDVQHHVASHVDCSAQ